MYLTGGQPVRGTELAVLKFQNTRTTLRNFFVQKGTGFYVTEYHKARASTNHSFCVARYLPERVAKVVSLYLVYIRPFALMMISAPGKTKPRDLGYMFCFDRSPDKCWKSNVLSAVLQKESLERLGVKLNLQLARHILIGVTKVHVKKIACFFSKDDKACEEKLSKDPNYLIWAYQAGHQRATNEGFYGNDTAYPAQLQPGLLRLFKYTSGHWHRWIGLESTGGEEPGTPVRKRKHGETPQTTPTNKIGQVLDVEVDVGEDSPVTKKYRGKMEDITKKYNSQMEGFLRLIEIRKEERELEKRLMEE